MEIIYLKISLAIIFTLSVIAKFTGKVKSTFEKAGYSKTTMYVIAIAEIVLTIMLFTKLELLATINLLAIIGGAIYTLYRQRAKPEKYAMAIVSAFLLAMLLCLLMKSFTF